MGELFGLIVLFLFSCLLVVSCLFNLAVVKAKELKDITNHQKLLLIISLLTTIQLFVVGKKDCPNMHGMSN
mgnify:CR=1 FL=1